MNFTTAEIGMLFVLILVAGKLIDLIVKHLFGRVIGDYRTRIECDTIRKDCKKDMNDSLSCIVDDINILKKGMIVLINYNDNIPHEEKTRLQRELI